MAMGQLQPFEAVATPAGAGSRQQRPLRIAAACAVALALLAAVVAVQRPGSAALMQGSDETMKGWEDGMFPPHATFPAGYHFGDDNGGAPCPAARCSAALPRGRGPPLPALHAG